LPERRCPEARAATGALWRSPKRDRITSAFRTDAAREVLWADACSEGYLQASPDVRYVGDTSEHPSQVTEGDIAKVVGN
jgi:hypothetical protein